MHRSHLGVVVANAAVSDGGGQDDREYGCGSVAGTVARTVAGGTVVAGGAVVTGVVATGGAVVAGGAVATGGAVTSGAAVTTGGAVVTGGTSTRAASGPAWRWRSAERWER